MEGRDSNYVISSWSYYSGEYSFTKGKLTLKYYIAEWYSGDNKWIKTDIPPKTTYSCTVNMNDYNIYTYQTLPSLKIKGIIRPFTKTTDLYSVDGVTSFWKNEKYTGPPMGYMKP